MSYYHSLITQKSWQELIVLNKKVNFVLIGGWAAYLYTKQLKSKDIDILVEYGQLAKLKKNYDVTKNDRLKKYQAQKDEIQIDIYLPHYSQIGIPVEILINNEISFEGFKVLRKEWLIALKIYVLSLRAGSVKGEKDFLDLLSLFGVTENINEVGEIIKKYRLESKLAIFLSLLDGCSEALEINLNKHQYKKLKTRLKGIFGARV